MVAAYLRHYPKCIINKTTRSKMPGSVASIEAPTDATSIPSAFEAVNTDQIVALPKRNGFDAILVIIDRFTKTAIFTPTVADITAELIAEINGVFTLQIHHGQRSPFDNELLESPLSQTKNRPLQDSGLSCTYRRHGRTDESDVGSSTEELHLPQTEQLV